MACSGEHGPPIIECMLRKLSSMKLVETRLHMITKAHNVLIKGPLVSFLVLMFEHIDHALITTFVKRWQPDMNTFHMHFGEMTIMLHYVENIF